jgi:S-adenosylmethionine decarboxylase
MPSTDAASSYADLRRREAGSAKRLYAIDAVSTPASPLSDVTRLADLAGAAVRAGGGHVLATSHALFPNGAITLVLILAESHLSLHTWPEESLIAIDLFSCGSIDGQRVLTQLTDVLHLDAVRVTELDRGDASPRGRAG